jgi:peroxiredoxin Q/BCP
VAAFFIQRGWRGDEAGGGQAARRRRAFAPGRRLGKIRTRMAKAPTLKLKAGDPAPAFTVATNGGGKLSLSDFKGQNVILYFYPKDDTPGCTREACAFRDHFAQFQQQGAVVLGVSTDPAAAHDKFVQKFRLPFPLLADEDRKLVEAYGVWGEKVFMGRKYQGTHRVTFLIGGDGRIRKIWPEVKPDEHAAEVLAALKSA